MMLVSGKQLHNMLELVQHIFLQFLPASRMRISSLVWSLSAVTLDSQPSSKSFMKTLQRCLRVCRASAWRVVYSSGWYLLRNLHDIVCQQVKRYVNGNPSQSYKTSPSMCDHSVTYQPTQRNVPHLIPSKAGQYSPSFPVESKRVGEKITGGACSSMSGGR